jgi:DNA-binding CsgD family transcriptional regulator
VEIGGEQRAVLTFSLGEPALPVLLSAAEREVALALLAGRSNAQIASARKTSVRTVANQVMSTYRKLGVRSRKELIVALSSRGSTRGPETP